MAVVPGAVAQLDGLYKQTYAKKIEDAVPACAHILKKVPFSRKEIENGSFYNQPVILTQEQGWTYLPAGSTSATLLGNVNMKLANAQLIGNIIAGQAALTVEAAKRATGSGPNAFEDAVGLQMRVLMESGRKRQEVNFLYGESTLALAASSVNSNTHQTVVTIVTSEWAAGFWAGMQNAKFDAYQNDGATIINVTAPYTVVTCNAAARSVTFACTDTTDLAALDTYIAANANKAQFYFTGALLNESYGLKAQLTNTTTLFNISAAAYDLWAGTTYTVPGPGTFSFAQLQKAIGKAVSRGLDEDVTVYVNPQTWANLLTDQAALRMYTNASGTFENGADKIVFMGQNGKIEIVSHIFVKEGDAFIIPFSKISRVGSSPMTFNIPGTDKGRIFIQQSGALSFEYRAFSQETLFVEMPARAVYVNGIVN